MLSRVSWPTFRTSHVLEALERATGEKRIKRICIQALNYPEVFADLLGIVKAVHQRTSAHISISCQPLNSENMRSLAEAGAERIGIPLDAATEEVFSRAKGLLAGGPYDWTRQFELLYEAVGIFGKGKVSTHFIVGLGETEREMVVAIDRCADADILPALFAFTPISGTALENTGSPSVPSYRRIQFARYLIVHRLTRVEAMRFDETGRLVDYGVRKTTLTDIVRTGKPFLTSGCPDCNRPYYNEKPSGPIYNFPKPLTGDELSEVERELALTEV